MPLELIFACFDIGCQAVIVYVTMYGSIIGWDLRANGNAWKIDNKLRQGVTILRYCSGILSTVF